MQTSCNYKNGLPDYLSCTELRSRSMRLFVFTYIYYIKQNIFMSFFL